jgi:S1-C subfamily serine protease
MNTRRFSVRAGLAVAAAAALITGAAWRGLSAAPTPTPAAAQTPAVTGRTLPAGTRDSYADIVKAVAPAVVTIRVEGKATASPTQFEGDDFFRRFFGEDEEQLGRPQRSGPNVPRPPDIHVVMGRIRRRDSRRLHSDEQPRR